MDNIENRYIRFLMELITIRPAAGGALVYSPISGETTAMVLDEVVRQWKEMTEVRGDDYGKMYGECAASGQDKSFYFEAGSLAEVRLS